MSETGKCTNYTKCRLAARIELIAVPKGAPFLCPECGLPLVGASPAGRLLIPLFIVGGLVLLVSMAAVAIYIQAGRLKEPTPAGQTGTSFEQAEVAAAKGEFPLSARQHVLASPSPSVNH